MNILNILSVVLTISLGTAAGLYKSAMLKHRVGYLTEFISMLEDIGVEIRCNKTPVYRIFQKLGEERYIFLKEIGNSMGKNGRFDHLWKEEIEKISALSEEDKRIIISVGTSLGRTDEYGQKAMLESNRLFLTKNLNHASAEYEKKGKMYRSVGSLLGLLAAVILI